MPIITNYFADIDTGHKDFVRSFVHLQQSGSPTIDESPSVKKEMKASQAKEENK